MTAPGVPGCRHLYGWDLKVPRPLRLILTAGWNLAESAGLPLAACAVAAWAGGSNAGLIAGPVAIWLMAVIRKIVTGSVPSLLTIPAVVLTVQAAVMLATGELVAVPAAVPAREPAHVRAVRPDGERPGPRSLRGWPPRWWR
jgi:hypothetical protein